MKFIRSISVFLSFSVIALFFSVFFSSSITKAAFGVSPPWIRNNQVLPGTILSQTIYLSRDISNEALKVTIRIEGDANLVQWIDIDHKDSLIMKKGQAILPVRVNINVPKNLVNQNYNADLFISLIPVSHNYLSSNAEVSIGLGAHVSVNLSIAGDKIQDYKIQSVSPQVKKQDDSLSVALKLNNIGNTEINHLNGKIDIYDDNNTVLLNSFDFVPFNDTILPNETKEVEMIFNNFKPEVSQYWVAVEISKNKNIVYKDRFLQGEKIDDSSVNLESSSLQKKADTKKVENISNSSNNNVFNKHSAPSAFKTKDSSNLISFDTIYFIFGIVGFLIALIASMVLVAVILFKKKTRMRFIK